MESMKQAFALYSDMACTKMFTREVRDGKTMWVVDFGRVDAGNEKTGTIYVKNIGASLIDEVEVDIAKSTDKDVEITLVSFTTRQRLESDDVFPVTVQWKVAELSDAKKCEGFITVKGMQLEEGYRPPTP